MSRGLTQRERDVVRAMVTHAQDSAPPTPIRPTQRQRWLRQIAATRAGRPCACGTCPTIELEDERGGPTPTTTARVVLSASAPGALLLLFIDDDRLSCLELAPLDPDARILEFPPVESIDFA
jgi:hypothetical protein